MSEQSWGEMLAKDPKPIIDLLVQLEKNGGLEALQVLAKVSRPGHPTMLVGYESEGYEPDDEDLASRGGVGLIAQERQRQISQEGYSAAHDLNLPSESLALAAACYATPSWSLWRPVSGEPPTAWPWSRGDWKPTPDDRLKELVKAGALIVAEIDRMISQRVVD